MIKPTRAFVASDGTVHTELCKIQEHEIRLILRDMLSGEVAASSAEMSILDAAASALVTAKEKVLDILTTSSRSRPATRKINGASRKPRATTPKAPTAS
jgi:hypothetical protein